MDIVEHGNDELVNEGEGVTINKLYETGLQFIVSIVECYSNKYNSQENLMSYIKILEQANYTMNKQINTHNDIQKFFILCNELDSNLNCSLNIRQYESYVGFNTVEEGK